MFILLNVSGSIGIGERLVSFESGIVFWFEFILFYLGLEKMKLLIGLLRLPRG